MLLTISFILHFCALVNSERILGIFHYPSKSHHILGSTLLKSLAKRGHEVTMLSPFSLGYPVNNYEEIILKDFSDKGENFTKQLLHLQNVSIFQQMSLMQKRLKIVNENFLNHTLVRNMLKSKRQFDLVIVCYFGNDAFLALPHYFNAHTIIFNTIGSHTLINQLTANPAPYSYVSNIMLAFPEEMTFIQRVANTISNIIVEIYLSIVQGSRENQIIQKYFPGAPSLSDLKRNVSLVLLNSHFAIESPKPHVPSMVQIGGFHVQEPKELTGDLKEFMDSSTQGVIYFSLGSNVKSSELPESVLKGIIKAFSKVPMSILWKFESENVGELPKNVKINQWLPQRDILAHPNLKLFITHGGLLSTTEAIYHGVPMVGIPIFADQGGNVDDGVDKEYMVKVPFLELSETSLGKAIDEVLTNSKYRTNIQRRSRILKDQPLKPIDNAVFWVEYVLRHKGAEHLKVSGLKLNWYQYYLLDVISFILVTLLITLKTISFIIRKIYRYIRQKPLANNKYKQKSKRD